MASIYVVAVLSAGLSNHSVRPKENYLKRCEDEKLVINHLQEPLFRLRGAQKLLDLLPEGLLVTNGTFLTSPIQYIVSLGRPDWVPDFHVFG